MLMIVIEFAHGQALPGEIGESNSHDVIEVAIDSWHELSGSSVKQLGGLLRGTVVVEIEGDESNRSWLVCNECLDRFSNRPDNQSSPPETLSQSLLVHRKRSGFPKMRKISIVDRHRQPTATVEPIDINPHIKYLGDQLRRPFESHETIAPTDAKFDDGDPGERQSLGKMSCMDDRPGVVGSEFPVAPPEHPFCLIVQPG